MNQVKQSDNLLPPLWVILLGVIASIVWLFNQLREVVILLVVAYALAYLIEPTLRALEKVKIRREIGFFVVIGIGLIILLTIIFTILPVLQREFWMLAENFPRYYEKLRAVVDPYLTKYGYLLNSPSEQLSANNLSEVSKEFLPKIFQGITTTLLKGYSLTLTIVNLALLPFIIFYLSMSFKDLRAGFLRYFPTSKRKNVDQMLAEINLNVSSFVRGQVVVSVMLFVLYAMGLGLTGIELWFLIAFLAGFGNLVPYLGTILGVLLGILMAFVTYGDFFHIGLVLAVFAIVQFLEGTVITPRVLGKNVSMSPLGVILAIIIGGKLFGLLGVFLAIPGAAIFRVISQRFHLWLVSKV